MAPTCIIDASVLVLAAQDEARDPRAAMARRLLPLIHEGYELAAPALIAWEIGQIVHVKRAADWSLAERPRVVRALLHDLDLDTPDAAALDATGRIAVARNLSFYDAAYLELASRNPDAVLLTEDTRLHQAGRALLGASRTHTLQSVSENLE